MEVKYIDLVTEHKEFRRELLAVIEKVLDHAIFILGPEVGEFESAFARYCGVRHAVGVNSGTDALFLALRALGVGPGDEVITVPNSFLASTSCVIAAGARPVFVDVRPDMNIDPALIGKAVTPRTKAVIGVHLGGRPFLVEEVLGVCATHGLALIEDCAQAVGAEVKGRRVGSFGRVNAFSFHPLKTLNAVGDAGALTTNEADLADRLRVLRNIGLRTRDHAEAWGINSRLDSLQAAILTSKLAHLERWTAQRRAVAEKYVAGLDGILAVPKEDPGTRHVYHTFVVQTPQRDALAKHLADSGIETKVHYPIPIHLQQAAKELGYLPSAFPETERLSREMLSLPVHHHLTAEQVEFVVQQVRKFFDR